RSGGGADPGGGAAARRLPPAHAQGERVGDGGGLGGADGGGGEPAGPGPERHPDVQRVGAGAGDAGVRGGAAATIAAERRGAGGFKTVGDAVMAAFPWAEAAVGAALAVQGNGEAFYELIGRRELTIKMGIHQGPCIAARANEGLDYFGSTVNIAARLHDESR